jgi:hypothetical protein
MFSTFARCLAGDKSYNRAIPKMVAAAKFPRIGRLKPRRIYAIADERDLFRRYPLGHEYVALEYGRCDERIRGAVELELKRMRVPPLSDMKGGPDDQRKAETLFREATEVGCRGKPAVRLDDIGLMPANGPENLRDERPSISKQACHVTSPRAHSPANERGSERPTTDEDLVREVAWCEPPHIDASQTLCARQGKEITVALRKLLR